MNIEQLAREAGGGTDWDSAIRNDPELANDDWVFSPDELRRFAALVLEEAAKVCESRPLHSGMDEWDSAAKAIRALAAQKG